MKQESILYREGLIKKGTGSPSRHVISLKRKDKLTCKIESVNIRQFKLHLAAK